MLQKPLSEDKFIRLPQVLDIFTVSKSTWWAGIKAGKYPRPLKLGPRMVAWSAASIWALVAKIKKEQPIAPSNPGRFGRTRQAPVAQP